MLAFNDTGCKKLVQRERNDNRFKRLSDVRIYK
jgi:hypothetical protein